ncbi:MAG: hypothetical protein Q8P81_03655 [Nanoarchaeota archaeon]|nr:hypothetical protein [Nanoarchaeota archaeon]
MKRLSLHRKEVKDQLQIGSLIERHRTEWNNFHSNGNYNKSGIKEEKISMGTVIDFKCVDTFGKGCPLVKWHSKDFNQPERVILELYMQIGNRFFLIQT